MEYKKMNIITFFGNFGKVSGQKYFPFFIVDHWIYA